MRTSKKEVALEFYYFILIAHEVVLKIKIFKRENVTILL